MTLDVGQQIANKVSKLQINKVYKSYYSFASLFSLKLESHQQKIFQPFKNDEKCVLFLKSSLKVLKIFKFNKKILRY